jgi:hypothetical protein
MIIREFRKFAQIVLGKPFLAALAKVRHKSFCLPANVLAAFVRALCVESGKR